MVKTPWNLFKNCRKTPIKDRECLIMEAVHLWKYLLWAMLNCYFIGHLKIFLKAVENNFRGKRFFDNGRSTSLKTFSSVQLLFYKTSWNLFKNCRKTVIKERECLIIEAADPWKCLLLAMLNYSLLRHIIVFLYVEKHWQGMVKVWK